jgi:carboxylate-amine ligase
MITVGVEEEYLLLDPVTGVPVPLVQSVCALAGIGSLTERTELQQELSQAQVEVATAVCTDLDEVGGHLLRLRHALGTAARTASCRLAACGAAPMRGGVPVPVTPEARYLALRAQAPRLVDEQLINGMHVHAAVPDRETGVAVLNRIQPWLPLLLAMGANSPLWEGQDTGFASWRTIVFGRWPASGMPPRFADLEDYERRLRALVDSGVVRDTGQVYWQARLSERYPTIEVRCLDVQLRAADAVMFAGIVRALVATAIREEKAGLPLPPYLPEMSRAAEWHAARYGLSGALLDAQGQPSRAGDLVYRLMEHITPALEEAGDAREVGSLVHRLFREGTPADRQRRALAEGGLPALLGLLQADGADA